MIVFNSKYAFSNRICMILILLVSFFISNAFADEEKPKPLPIWSDSIIVKASPIITTKTFKGHVTYYGVSYNKRFTASGERHDSYGYVAAHKFLPFGTKLLVSVGNKSIIVKVNDRGIFNKGVILDLSYQAAKDLGIIQKGIAKVTIKVIKGIT